MDMLTTLRLVVGGLLLLAGLFVVITAVIGTFRFRFCLNRLHAAAMADTCGLFFLVAGMVVLCGATFVSLKMILLLVLFWISCPVTSHLLVKLELFTDQDVEKECEAMEE